jgi:hypothetical protein
VAQLRRAGALAAAAAGVALLVSLFLPWSDERSPQLLAAFGRSPALQGIPAHASAWQVYSTADVALALLVVAITAAALAGSTRARLLTGAGAALGLAFAVHALGTPPTAGLTLAGRTSTGAVRYLADSATAGLGEIVAIAALALGCSGLLLSAFAPGAAPEATSLEA